MKTLRYGLLFVVQLGLASACFAQEGVGAGASMKEENTQKEAPTITASADQNAPQTTVKEIPASGEADNTALGCWNATKTAGQSCSNGVKGVFVTVDGDTACWQNTKDAAGICYNQGLEVYEQKNTQLRDKIVGWVEASPLNAEAKTWLIGQFSDAPRTSVAVTTGAALLAAALIVYGAARGLKALVSTKAKTE
jgi:hypothetical protein